ncbi:molybdenum cofactor biosynthesis protein B [Marinicrinis lubricantis]
MTTLGGEPTSHWKIAILTASDKASKSEKIDSSADVIKKQVGDHQLGEIVDYRIVPDELDQIAAALVDMADEQCADLIFTTGGTGFSPRDVTPEATLQVIERQAPGLAEAMRMASMQITRRAMLSRGVAGIRGRTLIINLPGSPKAVKEHTDAVIDQLPHALQILTGKQTDHA